MNYGRRLQCAIKTALLCGHLCASAVATTADVVARAEKGGVRAGSGAIPIVDVACSVEAEAEAGALSQLKSATTAEVLQPLEPMRGIPLPYLAPELWHSIFEYLRAADF